jgi:hypothetical protein
LLVARRFAFFDFNLKAEALILAALGLRWAFVYQISDSLTQIIQDDPRHRRT